MVAHIIKSQIWIFFLVFLNLYIAEQYSFLYRRTARFGTLIFASEFQLIHQKVTTVSLLFYWCFWIVIGRCYTERFIWELLFRKQDDTAHRTIWIIRRSKSRSSDLRHIKRSFISYSEDGVVSGHFTMSNRETSLFSVCFSPLFYIFFFDFLLMVYWALVSNHDCGFQKARRHSLSFPISVFQKKLTSSLSAFRLFSHIERWIYERMINDIWMGCIWARLFAFLFGTFIVRVSFFVSFSSPLFWHHLLS